jgi:hypothetical protein
MRFLLGAGGRAAVVATALLLSGEARAERKHGVAVYPGARYDASASEVTRRALRMDAACYRTDDALAKVTAFYRKQPGFRLLNDGAEGSFLKKGNVDVTVQRPWVDVRTGVRHQDTLLTIMKHD